MICSISIDSSIIKSACFLDGREVMMTDKIIDSLKEAFMKDKKNMVDDCPMAGQNFFLRIRGGARSPRKRQG